jgi:hypothetical protein
VSKFHTFWCLVTQESSFERRGLSFLQVPFFAELIPSQYRTPITFYWTPEPFIGLVRSDNFSSTFDHCFEHNMLTVSPPIVPILFPLDS